MNYGSFFKMSCSVKDTSWNCNWWESKHTCLLELCCAVRTCSVCKLDLAYDLGFAFTQVKAVFFVLVEVNCRSQEGSEQELQMAYIPCYGNLWLLLSEWTVTTPAN